MKDIRTAPFLVEICRTCDNMYRLGWDERNGGNISMLLEENEVAEYIDVNAEGRVLETKFDAAYIGGRYLIVTGTGQYFKNVSVSPETCLGIIKIAEDGEVVVVNRGDKGAAVVNFALEANEVALPTGLADGVYTDTVYGAQFKVVDGVLTGVAQPETTYIIVK